MLNVLDEFSHECLAIRVARKLKAIDVIDVLSDLFILRGVTPLQHDQASRLNRIQATSTGAVCPCIRRVAGCARRFPI